MHWNLLGDLGYNLGYNLPLTSRICNGLLLLIHIIAQIKAKYFLFSLAFLPESVSFRRKQNVKKIECFLYYRASSQVILNIKVHFREDINLK